MTEGLSALTEKEKETLRLLLTGHDAKSIAAHLDLSVHTINERLREARRKLAVSSSRAAARLLREAEEEHPQTLGDKSLGDAPAPTEGDVNPTPAGSGSTTLRRRWLIGGLIMSIAIALALFAASSLGGDAQSPASSASDAPSPSHAAVVDAAQHWLAFVDAHDWKASYDATASSFRKANTLQRWSDSAEKVQGSLGTMLSRQFVGVDEVPSPQGFTMVKFRTDYSSRAGVIETLSLVHEDGTWKVAGIYVS